MTFKDRKAVIFDLDGTIIESAPGILASAKYALEKLGREMDEGALRAFIGPPLEKCFSEVCGLPLDEVDRAITLYREKYFAGEQYNCLIYPGVGELLARLWAAGRKVLLATSKGEGTAKEILAHFGLDRYFSTIAGRTPERESKAEIIQYALDSVEASADEAVMVGDRRFDAEAAGEVNLSCIGVLYGYGSREELETSGAAAVTENAETLAELLGLTPATTVYLVRHCQPDISVHEDAIRPLTPKGQADALKVTECLWDKNITAVYSSGYLRAVDTVRDFAGKKGLPLQEDSDFREREMGEWIEDYEEWREGNRRQWDDFDYQLSSGETLRQVESRIRPALDRLLAKHAGERIAIAGHGTAFSVLLHSFDEAFGHDAADAINKRNPWIVQLIFQDGVLISREELL